MAEYTYNLSSSWILYGGDRYFEDVDFKASIVEVSFRVIPKDELNCSALRVFNMENQATVQTKFYVRRKTDIR